MRGAKIIDQPRPGGLAAIANRLACKTAVMALAVAGLAMTGSAALAATIERHDDPVMGCTLRLSGVIDEGDAERLEAVIEARDSEAHGASSEVWWEIHGNPTTRRICLDSPGGSFREAVRLARVILSTAMGTAIPEGATCDSACAIAFMAGTFFHPEGEITHPSRVLHPRGRLGFHAPRLLLEGRSYTAEETEHAYEIALQTISEILQLRSEDGYEFAESLFFTMLRTPHAQMFRPETVEEAARWGIIVAPLAWPDLPLEQSLLNICVNAEAAANDSAAHSREYWTQSDVAGLVNLERSEPFDLTARFNEGFGLEAVGHCQIDIGTDNWFGQPTGPFGFSRVEAMTGREHTRYWYVFHAHAPDTQIVGLRVWSDATRTALSRQIRGALQGSTAGAAPQSCWVRSSTARVVNVNEYVNLRRQPGFSAPVIRRVGLNETLRLSNGGNARGVGSRSRRQACQSACQAFDRNPQDHSAQARAQQCIDDNVIWYEVIDTSGNRGWISRRFLQQEG